MSITRAKQKQRGGARDESKITIDLNRNELAELLRGIQKRYCAFQLRYEREQVRDCKKLKDTRQR